MNNFTIIIKTFERYYALRRLLASINKKYPTISIIIVDDSKKDYKDKIIREFSNLNIEYIVTEYDIGLSKGRNILLDKVKTEFFVLCDDDVEFDERSDVELAISNLKENNLDILGGVLYNRLTLNSLYTFAWCLKKISRFSTILKKEEFPNTYNGFFKIADKDILLNINKDIQQYEDKDVYNVDICHNFFVAKTETVKKIGGWDNEELKVGEHEMFFFKAKENKLKVGFTPVLGVKHYPQKKLGYLKLRMRAEQYFKDACKKEGLSSFVIKDEKGNIIYSYDEKAKK